VVSFAGTESQCVEDSCARNLSRKAWTSCMAKRLSERRTRTNNPPAPAGTATTARLPTTGSPTRSAQLTLPCRGRGGYRPGAGRPRSGRAGVPHRPRPALAPRFPVHVTLRARTGLPSLRLDESRRVLTAAIAAARDRFGCRIVQFSIQSNHIHLICEADDQVALSRGVRGLLIRMARGLNRVHGLRGSVWADRYHARILRSPREVRAALVYVLGNWRHHGGERYPLGHVDPCSSAAWFDGYAEPTLPVPTFLQPPVAAARTWLLRLGYRRHIGKISVNEGAWPRRKGGQTHGAAHGH
jgi:REP element-mobilizing transposase RayT